MYPYIHLILPSYALLALIGGIVAICYVYSNIDKENILFTDLLRVILYGGVGLIVGSKLLYAITQIPWLVRDFSIENLLLLVLQSGYVFYGGLFGFIFAICFMCKGQSEYRKKMFRLIVPAIPLFHMFGRIGCFLSGCCYGKYLKNPLIIMGLKIDKIPVQLMEAIIELLIFMILCIIKKKNIVNNLLAVYLIFYAIARFGMEFLRGDEVRGLWAGLSTSQYISLFVIFYYVGRKLAFNIIASRVSKNEIPFKK